MCGCWWLNSMLVTYFEYCHQYIRSQTSVTEIDYLLWTIAYDCVKCQKRSLWFDFPAEKFPLFGRNNWISPLILQFFKITVTHQHRFWYSCILHKSNECNDFSSLMLFDEFSKTFFNVSEWTRFCYWVTNQYYISFTRIIPIALLVTKFKSFSKNFVTNMVWFIPKDAQASISS